MRALKNRILPLKNNHFSRSSGLRVAWPGLNVLLLFVLLFCQGCGLSPDRPAPDTVDQPYFVPPTLSPTQIPTPTPTTAPEEVAAQGESCADLLSFSTDLTIPDDTPVDPGSTLDKRWEVDNSGSCNWSQGYELRLISGDAMGAEPIQALPPARSGTSTTIRIQFTAPNTPGTYRGDWQAFNSQGAAFGDAFYIQIVVK